MKINYIDQIRVKLSILKPSLLEIIDETHLHEKHFQGKNSHFKIIIQSQMFKNLSLIERHKLIYKILEHELRNQIHALSIIAKE